MPKSHAPRMTLDEYQTRLHGYSDDYLLCKDIRHVWRITTSYTTTPDATDWVYRVLTCMRCNTVRMDYFRLSANSRRLERAYSTYRYPAGFSIRGLPEVKNPSEIMRFESYLRALKTVSNAHDMEEHTE